MENSIKGKRKFIFKSLKENYHIATIKKLPMMIRTNGIILSLEHLLSKKDSSINEIGSLLVEYIHEYKNIEKVEVIQIINNLRELNSFEYMTLQKDVYDFSVELKNLAVALENRKEDESE